MKLRLDEYYYIINDYWDEIEEYMPEDMANKLIEFMKSHNSEEINNYIKHLYSYIEVINTQYDIVDIDLEKGYTTYTAIVKINDKYYSFDYDHSYDWDFEQGLNSDQELIEVKPKEITTTIYVRN